LIALNLAFAPYRLTPDAGPLGRAQEGKKLRQVSFVLGFPYKSPERMGLTRSAAPAFAIYMADIAFRH